jgi:hypothetical protein
MLRKLAKLAISCVVVLSSLAGVARAGVCPSGAAACPGVCDSSEAHVEAAAANWQRGYTTYYTSNEGGAVGAGGKRLTPFKSVAVRLRDYKKFKGRRVDIKGFGRYVVEDACAGKGCKDFDIYVGDNVANARRLPNYKLGNIPVQYRWI